MEKKYKSYNITRYISEYVFNEHKISSLNSIIQKSLEYCDNVKNNIIIEENNKISINYLFDYLYVYNYLYKSIGLMRIMNPTNEVYHNIDNMLEIYHNTFYLNKQIYNKIKSFKILLTTFDELTTIEKILKQFENNFSQNSYNTQLNISYIEIKKKLDINYKITTDDNLIKSLKNKQYPELSNKISGRIYYLLQKKIKDPNIRNIIEKTYFKKSEYVMGDFTKIILHRYNYAKSLGFETYFDYNKQKSQEGTDEIKSLINDLINKLENRSRKEVERVHRELKKDGYHKKVDLYDIIYYYDKLKTKNTFCPDIVLKIIIKSFKKYFNINIELTDNNIKLWNDSVVTYSVKNDNNLIGYLYLDLEKRTDKFIISPISIHLCQQYLDLNGCNYPTRIALIAGYENKKCITYSDIIHLFREFGSAIQMMEYTTIRGVLFQNNEFDSLLPQIMEYIAWEKSTIEDICFDLDKSIVDHILFMRFIDFGNSIKLRCINALFDHIIHSSKDLAKLIEANILDNNYLNNIIKTLYKKIYHDVMKSQDDIINLNINGINPTLIYQEINGSGGMLYMNIFIEILSFGIFSTIKKESGSDFIKNVLNGDTTKIRKLMNEYISKFDDNSYDIYLQELIEYSEIDTELNKQKINANSDEENKYDDNSEINSDKYQIIHLK